MTLTVKELERRDYYGDLRVPHGASDAVIRQRFKRLARQYHPDLNPSPSAPEQFRRVRQAFDVLTDPECRRVVDSWYAAEVHSHRRRARFGAAGGPSPDAASAAASARPWRLSADAADRLWAFVTYGGIAFALTLLLTLIHNLQMPGRAFLVAIAFGTAVGLSAALGGSRAREFLSWLLRAYLSPWWRPLVLLLTLSAGGA